MLSKRLFISPLDWGLGHASRLIPLIENLKKDGHFILLGTEPKTAAFLSEIFPDLPQIPLKGYGIKYGKLNTYLKLLFQIPRLTLAIIQEHRSLKKIVKEYNINTIISDSRFGLWNKNTQNFIISHQLQILFPPKLWFFGKLLNWTNTFLLNRFDACLIPDNKNHDFSGILSQNKAIKNQQFLGSLSRFSLQKESLEISQNNQLVFIFSGPEPQRSIFEDIVISQLKKTSYTALLISGQPDKNYSQQITPLIKKVSHLRDKEFAKTLKQAKCVFSRSGYSSIMDYAALNLKQIVLIPTPNQTEQEYLANKFHKANYCFTEKQQDFSLENSLKEVKLFKGFYNVEYPPKDEMLTIF